MSSAISVTVDDLLCHRKKASPDYKRLIPRLTDSVALIGHVHKELSFKRRDAMRPFLNQEFKQACSRTLKPGKRLFGEYLPKTLQELKTTNKIMHKITPNAKRGSISQKNRYTSQYRGHSKNKSFLGSKGGGGGGIPFPPEPINSTTDSHLRRIPSKTDYHQNKGKSAVRTHRFLHNPIFVCQGHAFSSGPVISLSLRIGEVNYRY